MMKCTLVCLCAILGAVCGFNAGEKPDVWDVIRKLENKVNHVDDNVARRMNSFETRMTRTEETLQDLINQQVPVIAFAASTTVPRSIESGQKLMFDSIEINVGNGYNAQDGVFACPETGYYLMSATISSQDGSHCSYSVRREGTIMALQYSDAPNGKYDSSSSPVAMFCQAGQRVYVQADWEACRYGSSTDHGISYFTGILVSQ